MNTETGQILPEEQLKEMDLVFRKQSVPIDGQLITPKQLREKQVSKFDNRSPLGKFRIKHRNRLRNKPCPCGSGIKFKKCCWNKTC